LKKYKKIDSHIVESLTEIVGPENVLADEHELIPYTRDHQWVKYSEMFTYKPEVVVLPESAEHVVKLVQFANQKQIPIVPCGARTGMTGNCVPLYGGIQVDMKKMNKIIEIDTENMVAVVQSGTSLYKLDRELRKHGFICGHMPGSQPTATVGGAVSTNGWSEHRMKYGDIQDQVTSLRVVLPTGELVKVGGGMSGKVEKSSVGFGALKHLFIGTWGTLGIITEATLRIFPAPECVYSAAIAFDSLDQACKAARQMFMSDIPMAYLLVGDRNTVEFSRKVSPTFPDVNCIMTIIIEGNKEIVETSKKLVFKICEEFRGKDLGPEIGKAVWEEAYDAWGTWVTAYGPGYPLDEEGAIPYNRAANVAKHFEEILKKYNIDVIGIVVGLAPQYPILGCFWRVDERNEKKWEDYKRVSEEIAEIYLKEGGTISMAHGLGTRREEKFLPVELGTSYELMKKIKLMLDPNNIMNPGRFGLNDAYNKTEEEN